MFWDPSVFMVAMLFLGVGIVGKQLIFGMGMMYATFSLSKRMARGSKRGAAKHLLWAMGIEWIDDALKRYGMKPTQVDFSE